MSSRGRRIASSDGVEQFDWGGALAPAKLVPMLPGGSASVRTMTGPHAVPEPVSEPAPEADGGHQARVAAIERDAFAKGYAAGERAGAEAGSTRAEAMLRRLAQTIEELGSLRTTMVRQTERQMVQLAVAVAKRIVGREIALDADLVIAMVRVALDRLGEGTPAVIRLNPEDLAATSGQAKWGGSHVTVVADPAVSRGGCLVESEFGLIDASVDAQFDQIAQAMLGDVTPSDRVVPIRRAS